MGETPDGMTDLQLTELIRKVGIPYFRGVRMMDKLPRKIKANESGVVNYQDSSLDCILQLKEVSRVRLCL